MRLSLKKVAAVLTLSGVLLLVCAGVALAGPPWSDAPASWWTSSYGITETEAASVADGYPDGTFKPGQAVTRGQFAKMAVAGLEVATANPATPTFKDVARGGTFYIYVEGAYAAKLIGGYTSGASLYYKPNNTITREQANSILGRYLSKLEIDMTGWIHGDVTNYGTLDVWYNAEGAFYLNKFEDANKVSASHRAATAYLIRREIISGSNGKLSPGSTLVRAQAAAMVVRVKAEAVNIVTPPAAPTNLGVAATDGGNVVKTGAASYVGNDPTPRVTGDTLPSRPIAVYDTVDGVTTKLLEDTSNAAGNF